MVWKKKNVCPICDKQVTRLEDMAKHYDCFEVEELKDTEK